MMHPELSRQFALDRMAGFERDAGATAGLARRRTARRRRYGRRSSCG